MKDCNRGKLQNYYKQRVFPVAAISVILNIGNLNCLEDIDQKTILIIEDEQALLDSYTEILESGGFSVLKASDGYKGLEMLKHRHTEIDLVLLDLMMPGVDGLEVLKTVKENEDEYGSVPIVVLTAMTSEKVIKQAFDLGANSYLLKAEMDYDELVPQVKKVLGGQEE